MNHEEHAGQDNSHHLDLLSSGIRADVVDLRVRRLARDRARARAPRTRDFGRRNSASRETKVLTLVALDFLPHGYMRR